MRPHLLHLGFSQSAATGGKPQFVGHCFTLCPSLLHMKQINPLQMTFGYER